ncbi:MAG TPA: SDR family oxidoreductase [Conexibacter sp.]|nr:SDR family oxidoreductase [Conexibacter sp.]
MSRVVVITGASAGVGRATARAFAARGDRVALIARGRAGLAAVAREVTAAGGTPLELALDVADADAVEAAAQRVEDELGPIDVWVNNAMTAVLAEVMETTPAEFRRVTEVTYLGSVHGAQAALRRMLPRDRGHLVQVGSALTRRGIPLQATYCGAKHALDGFVDSLRTELRHRGSNVQLTLVQLPGMNTTQFHWVRARTAREPMPVPPIYQPEVAARAIVWASEHRRRELWVGLPTAKTLLGQRIAPWYADRVLARSGIEDQQTDRPLRPDRPDYVSAPLDDERDHGVHGDFGAQAKERDVQSWLGMHRAQALGGALGAAAAAALAGAGLARRRRG